MHETLKGATVRCTCKTQGVLDICLTLLVLSDASLPSFKPPCIHIPITLPETRLRCREAQTTASRPTFWGPASCSRIWTSEAVVESASPAVLVLFPASVQATSHVGILQVTHMAILALLRINSLTANLLFAIIFYLFLSLLMSSGLHDGARSPVQPTAIHPSYTTEVDTNALKMDCATAPLPLVPRTNYLGQKSSSLWAASVSREVVCRS